VWFTKVAVPGGSCPQARPSSNTAGHVTGSGRHMIVGDSAEAKAIFEKIKIKEGHKKLEPKQHLGRLHPATN